MKAAASTSGPDARVAISRHFELLLIPKTTKPVPPFFAPRLGMTEQASKIDDLIGALLGTRELNLTAPTARARQTGNPYDPERIELFQSLYAELRNSPPVIRLMADRTPKGNATLAFFESYFSNFIKGTEFEVEEAADFVFRGVIPSARPEDLERLLKHSHAAIMDRRPDKQLGEFKQTGNRAGATTFVAPELVDGTLKAGFEIYQGLEDPFQMAVFMMFLVSEIHPFIDGNGRTARIMMNAELVATGEERIIIPTVYRENYLAALKAISQNNRPHALIRTLDYAQKWTASVDWTDLSVTQKQLEKTNAFLDPITAEEMGQRLKLAE
jgi:hypothetical protein